MAREYSIRSHFQSVLLPVWNCGRERCIGLEVTRNFKTESLLMFLNEFYNLNFIFYIQFDGWWFSATQKSAECGWMRENEKLFVVFSRKARSQKEAAALLLINIKSKVFAEIQCKSVSVISNQNLPHSFTTLGIFCVSAVSPLLTVTGLLFYHRHHRWLVKRKGRNNLIAQQRP